MVSALPDDSMKKSGSDSSPTSGGGSSLESSSGSSCSSSDDSGSKCSSGDDLDEEAAAEKEKPQPSLDPVTEVAEGSKGPTGIPKGKQVVGLFIGLCLWGGRQGFTMFFLFSDSAAATRAEEEGHTAELDKGI